ncbi:hypothetical protein CP982_26710 [Streptomyces spectabilis]|uniref:Uncharacterized protein n=1 Tax=Streptomyces spectabilis TaxID=68270 RepID=A0A5P2XBR2_STRST|nr:hypothetical protein CP982_26710 [Streptomyces spectabilis]
MVVAALATSAARASTTPVTAPTAASAARRRVGPGDAESIESMEDTARTEHFLSVVRSAGDPLL